MKALLAFFLVCILRFNNGAKSGTRAASDLRADLPSLMIPSTWFGANSQDVTASATVQQEDAIAKVDSEVKVTSQDDVLVSMVAKGANFITEISSGTGDDLEAPSPVVTDASVPKVNFLFMAYDSLPHVATWEKFFQGGYQSIEFRVFVHCKYEELCKQSLEGHPLFELIPSIETSYCFGLVSAMNALLHSSLGAGPGHKNDKFTFVSDSTLPVKPFRFVYNHLTENSDSSFCFFPQHWMPWSNKSKGITSWFSDWSALQVGEGDTLTTQRMALKHHQWMSLSRDHALQAVEKDGMFLSLLRELHVNSGLPGTISGCDDEFWHFNALLGGINVTTAELSTAEVVVPGINNGHLRYDSSDLQGQCDTFVYWQDTTDGLGGPVQLLGKKLEVDFYTRMSHKLRHPCDFTSLGRNSIRALRDSSYLFARKITAGCSVHGSYRGQELIDLPHAFDVMIFKEQDPHSEDDDMETVNAVDLRTVNPNDMDEPQQQTPGSEEMNETLAPRDLPREITGDLSIYVDDPELCSNSPVFQAASQKALAAVVGAKEKEVQVDVRISKTKSWASYLKMAWGNVDVKFRVLLLGTQFDDALQRAHEVRALIRAADLPALTKQLRLALQAKHRIDDSVQAVSMDFHSLRALPKPTAN